jgi:L-lactate dehydrogenase complex protein LldG
MHGTARSDLLSRIRTALAGSHQTQIASDNASADADFDQAGLIERFETELKLVGGFCYVAQNRGAARDILGEILRTVEAKKMVAWHASFFEEFGLSDSIPQAGLDLFHAGQAANDVELITKATHADVGITIADFLLADTGTVVLLADERRPRCVSLLPPVHIAIARKDAILPGIDELFSELRPTVALNQGLSSAITFITGPSRTADIEMTLVMGVHGPQQLHVILLDS